MRMLLILVLSLSLLMHSASAADYAVVVSSSADIQPMQVSKIRDVFLKKRRFANGKKMFPVNVLGDNAARRVFEQNVLRMERQSLNEYWIQNHFQGITPPVTQASLNSIKLFVEKVDGAIGYLPLTMVDSKLSVVHEF